MGLKKETDMKKTLKRLGLAALTLTLFSCGKETVTLPSQPVTDIDATENGDKPGDVSGLDPDRYLVSFGARVEDAKTKVSVDLSTGALALEDGDEALVVDGTASGIYVYNAQKAQFNPKTVDDAVALSGNEAHVYYPAGEFACSAGTVTFTMPEAVSAGSAADLGDKLPLCGTIPATDSPVASFKNLCSVLHVRFNAAVADGETITAVALSGSGVNITGSGTVTWADTDDQVDGLEPVLAALSGDAAGSTLTIDCKAAPKHLTSAAYQDFFFFLPQSGEFASMQVKAIYGKTDGSQTYELSEQVNRKSAMTLSRGKMLRLEKTLKGFFSGGDGSSSYPYVIASVQDFKALSAQAHETAQRNFFRSAGANYQQAGDIDFEGEDITSYTIGVIGSTAEVDSFKGIYDGNSHKLSHFTVSSPATNTVALFPNMQGEVKNLTLEDITVEGNQNTGGLVGWLNGKVTSCQIIGTSSVSGANATGGIAASVRNASVLYGCVNRAAVTSTGSNTGGVAGYVANSGKLELCNNYGAVSGATQYGVGGILGACNESGAKVLGCQNFGSVTGVMENTGGLVGRAPNGIEINASSGVFSRNEGVVTGVNSTGGIIGRLGSGSIACTTNAGDVEGTYNVGGIVGLKSNGGIWSCVTNEGDVRAQYNVGGLVGTQEAGGIAGNVLANKNNKVQNKGTVTATGKSGNLSYAGGLVGRMKGGYLGDPSVKKTVENTGNVTGTGSGQAVGGMVGYMEAGTVSHCSSASTVVNNQKCVGGAIGWLTGGKVYNCYAKGIVKGNGQVGGFVGYIMASADTYIVNCLAGAERVVATNKASNDGVGGFVGYMNQAAADKSGVHLVIANCAVWDGIVKAPNEDNAAENKIRVGGFVGVENAQSGGSANVMIQNCYYQGLPTHVGFGGGVDDDTLPTDGPSGSGVAGCFGGYVGATIRDSYCDNAGNANNRFVGGGKPVAATSGNYSRLRTNMMYGKSMVTWKLTMADGTEVPASTQYLDGLLNLVAGTVDSFGSIALCTWDHYTDGDDKYYYPSTLTSMGEAFYRK